MADCVGLENRSLERDREFESHIFLQHMVLVVKRLRPRIVIPIYVGSNPIKHPNQCPCRQIGKVGSSRESVSCRFKPDQGYQDV